MRAARAHKVALLRNCCWSFVLYGLSLLLRRDLVINICANLSPVPVKAKYYAVMLRGAGFRFVHSVFITSARRIKYAFDKHLFATNVTISLTLSGMGDILQQHHNIIRQQQHSWDRARTCHMTCTGVTVGTLCHHWLFDINLHTPFQRRICYKCKARSSENSR
ncbi:uncharacterized protein LOC135107670 isoform X2 [Scylla paramamosain]|uniref:uncharacterized protein LOC135107670 isoform X2 n=1 Tax=Scylla paramamosain TaxID=85552 RepID=UPI003083E67E